MAIHNVSEGIIIHCSHAGECMQSHVSGQTVQRYIKINRPLINSCNLLLLILCINLCNSVILFQTSYTQMWLNVKNYFSLFTKKKKKSFINFKDPAPHALIDKRFGETCKT